MQNTIIHLIEQIVGALGTEFKIYLPQIIPQVLRVFMHDNSQGRVVTAKVKFICETVTVYTMSLVHICKYMFVQVCLFP